MAELQVAMTAEEADLFSKITTLVGKTKQTGDAFTEAGKKSEAAAKAARTAASEQNRLANQGKRLAESLAKHGESAEEAYNRQAEAIRVAFSQGKISADQFKATVKKLDDQFDELTKAEKLTGKVGKDALDTLSRESSVGVKYVKKLKLEAKGLTQEHVALKKSITAAYNAGEISSKDYRNAIAKVNSELKDSKKKHENVFDSASSGLRSTIASWVSVTSVVSAATLAVGLYNEEVDNAKQKIKEREVGLKDLATISENQVELIERTTQARKIQSSEGVNVDRASQIVFKLDSVGLIGNDQDISDNNAVTKFFGQLEDFTDATTFAELAGQSKASFGVGFKEAVNIGLKASEASPLNADELAKQIAEASRGASLLNAKDQQRQAIETAALTSALSVTAGTSSGNIVKGAATKLSTAFEGQTVLEAAKSAAALSKADYKQLFGDNENVRFLVDAVTKREAEIKSLADQIAKASDQAGTERSLVNRRRGLILNTPDYNALKLQRVEEEKRAIAAEEAGRVRIYNDAAYARAQGEVNRGFGFFQERFGSYAAPIDRLGNYAAFGTANLFGNKVANGVENEAAYDWSLQEFYLKQEQQAERRHRESMRNQSQQPLITRPGDDS